MFVYQVATNFVAQFLKQDQRDSRVAICRGFCIVRMTTFMKSGLTVNEMRVYGFDVEKIQPL